MRRRWQGVLELARNRDGNALLEFALGSAVLAAAFTGTFQFGYTFLQYNNLQNAVSRGARYASLVPYDSATGTPSSAFQTTVKNVVLYGAPATGTSPVLRNLTAANINVTMRFANGVPTTVVVSIRGYTIDSVFGSLTLADKPAASYAYQGIWAPV